MASRRPLTDYELLGIIENDLSDMECLSGDEDDLGWSADLEDSGDSENEHEKNDCYPQENLSDPILSRDVEDEFEGDPVATTSTAG
ncbi:hypothetical protein JTB14_001830 [Gonioctena quinquepunctata]|nr:hypothetical protein JTB14_001830 [Gonioctena quinquepunctata]